MPFSNGNDSNRNAKKPPALPDVAGCRERLGAKGLDAVKSALSVDTSPLVEAACAGVAKVACTEQPPKVFRDCTQQFAQVLGRLKCLLWPPDADDGSYHTQQNDAVIHVKEGLAGATRPRVCRIGLGQDYRQTHLHFLQGLLALKLQQCQFDLVTLGWVWDQTINQAATGFQQTWGEH